jgi:hypothetical protein
MYKIFCLFIFSMIGTSLFSQQKKLRSELDTIINGGTVIAFSKSDKASFDQYAFKIPDTTERKHLIASNGKVKRKGNSLIFNCNNGKKLTLTDKESEGDDIAIYRLQGMIKEPGFWIVIIGQYEGLEYLLINQQNGEQTATWGYPHVSPDKKYLLVGSVDLVAGFIPNGLQLFEYSGNTLKKVFERELTKWSAERFGWKNNQTILAERITLNKSMNPVKSYISFRIR